MLAVVAPVKVGGALTGKNNTTLGELQTGFQHCI
jgi:hypothetical protein